MNERPAKLAVIFHLLFTVASLLIAVYYFFFVPHKSIVTTIALPLWMGYSVFATIKGLSDIIGKQRRFANFTRMLARWEDTFESRAGALALLTFMTVIVGAFKLAIPLLVIQI